MDTVSPFWSGAQDLMDRLDLEALAARVGGWQELARQPVDGLESLGIPRAVAERWLATPPRSTRGTALTRLHPHYPPVLAARPKAPPVLFVEGDPSLLSRPAVALVGTRRCTPYGAALARHLGAALAQAGVIVVSGLARGIDTHAHRGACEPGRTVAVLGHGLGHTAPPANRGLRKAIVDAGGTMVTTFADDHPPARWTFPSRNRWIAGLVERLVVIEAPKGSGALITAGFAADIDVDVYAVPGRLGSASSEGTHRLLQEGAHILVDVDEFVAEVAQPRLSFGSDAWLRHVLAGGTVTEAARLRGSSALEVLEELSRLEVAGRLVRLPGGRYAARGESAS